MKKWLKANRVWLIVNIVAIAVIVAVSFTIQRALPSKAVVPDVRQWDTTTFPVETEWVSPPKTWFSNYHAGDEPRQQTIIFHAPKYFHAQKEVTTTLTDNGILVQPLSAPLLDNSIGGSELRVISADNRDKIKIDAYNSETRELTISGFAPIDGKRLVDIYYLLDHFSYAFYIMPIKINESGKEIINPPEFASVGDSVKPWTTFSYADRSAPPGEPLIIDMASQQTVSVILTLSVPDGVSLPDNWVFAVGCNNTTGRQFTPGILTNNDPGYKFIISSGNLRLKSTS